MICYSLSLSYSSDIFVGLLLLFFALQLCKSLLHCISSWFFHRPLLCFAALRMKQWTIDILIRSKCEITQIRAQLRVLYDCFPVSIQSNIDFPFEIHRMNVFQNQNFNRIKEEKQKRVHRLSYHLRVINQANDYLIEQQIDYDHNMWFAYIGMPLECWCDCCWH